MRSCWDMGTWTRMDSTRSRRCNRWWSAVKGARPASAQWSGSKERRSGGGAMAPAGVVPSHCSRQPQIRTLHQAGQAGGQPQTPRGVFVGVSRRAPHRGIHAERPQRRRPRREIGGAGSRWPRTSGRMGKKAHTGQIAHFDGLVNCRRRNVVTGKPGYPVERTLLTTCALQVLFRFPGVEETIESPGVEYPSAHRQMLIYSGPEEWLGVSPGSALALMMLPVPWACAAPAPDFAAAREEAVRLLSDYLRIDTTNPPGNETRGAQYLERDSRT